MSDTGNRGLLAAAASTIDGVTVTPFYRSTTKPGQGYVRMDGINYPNPFGGVVTWQVCIVLSQDLAAAEKWMAENAVPVAAAVNEVMQVKSIRPVSLVIDGGAVPAVVIEGFKEQE